MSGTINWRDWSEGAFAAAAAENKPMLLSLVTAWSEECSLMDATTFAQPAVAAAVEGGFVAVRVDADRRPDLNERYNLGGWPTTVLLTPDGQTLSGGTYMGAEQMTAWLSQVMAAWRDRGSEIRARAAGTAAGAPVQPGLQVDETAPHWLRSLLIDQFDAANGGFGAGAKFPHPHALTFALALADEESDAALKDIVEVTLDRVGALWDVANGGFYRYADSPDWSRPGTEKTLEDNAALLGVYLDAGIRLHSDDYRNRAIDLVRWVRRTLADEAGGFCNSQAAVSHEIDRSMYVDRNADMVSQFLRAAVLFDDPWLRDFALKSLEAVIVPGYTPGGGVAHEAHGVRGLLGDQIRGAAALIWAHLITGQLPYSMLALELVQYATRTMWDGECFCDRAGGDTGLGLLREPIRPFALNCEAACVLSRLATLTGDESHRERGTSILRSLSSDYRGHGLFGAPYALAVREVMQRHPPLGLELSYVDWHLEKD